MQKKTFALVLVHISLVAFGSVAYAQELGCNDSSAIVNARVRSVGHISYIIFDLRGSETNASWKVEKGEPPFQSDPSDEVVSVQGSNFYSILFETINHYCETNIKTARSRGGIADLKKIWAFEGSAEFVVGLKEGSKYERTYSYPAGDRKKVVMKFTRK